MSIEVAITALAEAIRYHADALVLSAGVQTRPVVVTEDKPATTVVTEDKPKTSRSKAAKPAVEKETPVDPDVEKEVPEEKEERPATKTETKKPEFDAEKCRNDIRAVFQQLAAINPDAPLGVLKSEGITPPRISGASDDQLPALLLAARDALASLTPASYD
jgi:hypothetical protein